MRLLFLSNFFPPHELGGYAQLCHEVATALAKRGHAVHILTSNHQDDRESPDAALPHVSETGASSDTALPQISEDTPSSDAELPQLGVTRTLHLQADIAHYRPFQFLRRFQQDEAHNQAELTALLARFQPDVVFVWGMWNLSLQLPRLAENIMPGRVAYYLCSYWPEDEDIHLAYWNLPTNRKLTGYIKAPLKWIAGSYFQRADYPPALAFEHVACVSQYVRDRLTNAGLLPTSARVIYNGGDLTPFYNEVRSPKSDMTASVVGDGQQPLRLLYFGRLIADKGAHTAFEALTHLCRDGYGGRVKLTVLGNGRDDYMSRLRRYAVEEKIDHLINFQQGVPRDEVPEWLHKHDVFLFTSIWAEPLARSVMEAMMAGLLVVGSEVGGQKEMMINGENALTFQAEDAMGLAEQIKAAIDNPDERVAMAKNGQQMVMERFTQKRMVDEMEAWLKELGEW